MPKMIDILHPERKDSTPATSEQDCAGDLRQTVDRMVRGLRLLRGRLTRGNS